MSEKYFEVRTWLGVDAGVRGLPEVKTHFVQSDGRPEIFFHGTCGAIEKFDFAFTNDGHDQLGSGFYFTTCPSEAAGFANDLRRAGNAAPNIVAAFIEAESPLEAEHVQPLSKPEVTTIIEASPNLEEALSDWGDIEFEGRQSVIERALDAYVGDDEEPLLRTLFKLANDFYDDEVEAFNRVIQSTLGYDCVVHKMDDKMHVAVWFPEQVIFPYCDKRLYPEVEPTQAPSLSPLPRPQ